MPDPKPNEWNGYAWSADSPETTASEILEAAAEESIQSSASPVPEATPAESTQAATNVSVGTAPPEDDAQPSTPTPSASQPPASPVPSAPPPASIGTRPTPADYVIGGTRLLSDAVTTWRKSGSPTLDEAILELSQDRTVLLPQAQWEAVYGPLEGNRARYAAIGLAVSLTEGAQGSGNWLLRTADTISDRVVAPVYNSRLMGPVRRRIEHLTDAGEAKVDQWVALGRAREHRSLLLTQATVHRLFDETVEAINEGPIVQEIVQDVVRAQSQNLTRSFLDEVREFAVTLDLAVEYRVRRLLGRPSYPTHATPDYPVVLRGQPFDPNTLGARPYLGGQFAGFVSRAAAFTIDIFIVAFVLAVAGMFYTALRDIFFLDRFLDRLFGTDAMATIRAVVAGLAATVVAMGYWLIAWMVTGETLGHAIMGVRVMHREGARLNFWQALRRLLGYVLSLLPLGLGFLWVLIDNRRDGWHDKIAGTDAVYIWHARPDESFLSRQVAQVYQAEKSQNATDSPVD